MTMISPSSSAELVLRVDEDEAALGAHRLPRREQLHRERRCDVEVVRRHVTGREDLLTRAAHVVLPLRRFGRRRENGRGELLVFLQAVRERMAAEQPLAPRVVRPEARRGRAGRVGADDHLDHDRLAVDALDDVRVGHRQDVVRNDPLRLVEPPRGQAVQHLPLERDGAEHAVERADPIGRDDVTTSVGGRVVVPDFPLVLRAERRKVGRVERVRESGAERGLVDHGARTSSRRVSAGEERAPTLDAGSEYDTNT